MRRFILTFVGVTVFALSVSFLIDMFTMGTSAIGLPIPFMTQSRSLPPIGLQGRSGSGDPEFHPVLLVLDLIAYAGVAGALVLLRKKAVPK